MDAPDRDMLETFIERVWLEGRRLYRDFPWRNTKDPYAVFLSEVMLQQTQVSRVCARWEDWLARFPTIDALAAASLSDVLERWQGMGYNRRALALKRCADIISEKYAGLLPRDYDTLLSLPGIGLATAAGICVFAYQTPKLYLETNVRTVFLHEFFAEREQVSDREILPLLAQTCPDKNPGPWYYALLDYGAHLKKILPNPSRRSAHHNAQSAFEGSARQKRAELIRLVLAAPGLLTGELLELLADAEQKAGRKAPSDDETTALLETLTREGFLEAKADRWHIRAG